MLILKAVSLNPLRGYGVLLRILQISHNAIKVPQGSLYPALYRLEHQALIVGECGYSMSGVYVTTISAAGIFAQS